MKEESGFGFKDRSKAEETLRLLEEHEPNYRRLTVRGLLGRARRVLSLTKAEDKIKNIKEAMEVFENWLADLDQNKEKKSDKKESSKEEKKKEKEDKKEDKKREKEEKEKDSKDSSDEGAGGSSLPAEGVPGLGFKDGAAARASLAALHGRDPDYQLLAVRGLLRRARRVLTLTKDEGKLADIKEAMGILEQFTREFESSGRAAQACAWLRLPLLRAAHARAAHLLTDQHRAFLSSYEAVRGEYKRLRNVASPGGDTWDRVRNKVLGDLKEKHAKAKLFNEKEEPTDEHLEMILWAYSPDANRLKKALPEIQQPDKMDVDTNDDDEDKPSKDKSNKKQDSEEKKKEERKSERNDRKRRSSAKSDDESHSKKRKD